MNERSNLHKKKRHSPGRLRKNFYREHPESLLEVTDHYFIARGQHSRNPEARDPQDPHWREVRSIPDLRLLLEFHVDDYEDRQAAWVNALHRYAERWVKEEAQKGPQVFVQIV